MKRNQWIRLAVFLVGFAVFLMLPVHKYWMLEYTKGRNIVLQVKPLPAKSHGNRIEFECVEKYAPAGKDATALASGFVYFHADGRFAGVADKRKNVPDNAPYLNLRNLKLSPDGKSYEITLHFSYFAENQAEAAALLTQMESARSIALEIAIFPNGDHQIKKLLIK